jgi:DNA repair exonuclease SbcCD nuclease subunit
MYIVAADLHLRKDVPLCRGETKAEWMEKQLNNLKKFFSAGGEERTCLVAGDIFHKAKPGYETVSLFMDGIADADVVYAIAGNHDTLHTVEDEDTGWGIISKVLMPRDIVDNIKMVHTLTFESEKDVPFGVKHYETPETLVAKYPGFRYIVVGDMHRPFKKVVGDCTVVNCGSITVQNINEAEYPHGYWVLDGVGGADFVPTEEDIILADREDTTDKDIRDGRITAFMEKLKKHEGITLDYMVNVRNATEDTIVIDKIAVWAITKKEE